MAIPDPLNSMRYTVRVRTLNAILEKALPALERPGLVLPSVDSQSAGMVDVVRRRDLAWRESLLVTTKNSIYAINRAGDDTWFVWGGWFARHGQLPAVIGINGCTWGGSVIYPEILAAPGLFLEFANGVTTTRIRSVAVLAARGTLDRDVPRS